MKTNGVHNRLRIIHQETAAGCIGAGEAKGGMTAKEKGGRHEITGHDPRGAGGRNTHLIWSNVNTKLILFDALADVRIRLELV